MLTPTRLVWTSRWLAWATAGVLLAGACKRVTPSPEVRPHEDEARTSPGHRVQDLAPFSPRLSTTPVAEPHGSTAPQAGTLSGPLPRASAAPDDPSRAPTSVVAVKRLVIASDIKDREPVATDTIRVDEPVFAFLELDNADGLEGAVQVVFEHESGKQVGFVDLVVPAHQNRWRTWAQTAYVKTAGKWSAIVKNTAGDALARADFTAD